MASVVVLREFPELFFVHHWRERLKIKSPISFYEFLRMVLAALFMALVGWAGLYESLLVITKVSENNQALINEINNQRYKEYEAREQENFIRSHSLVDLAPMSDLRKRVIILEDIHKISEN